MPLTVTEYELLRVLSLSAGRVVPYEALLRQVWGKRAAGDVKVVRAFVKALRRKLGDDATNPGLPLDRARGRLPLGRTTVTERGARHATSQRPPATRGRSAQRKGSATPQPRTCL